MIFLSHSVKDKARLDPLVAELRSRGLEVWYANFAPGDDVFDEMGSGLERAEHLLVAWSRHAAASHHVATELSSFYMAHPEPGPIVFMRLDETEVKSLLRHRQYFRATGDAAHDASVVEDWVSGRRNAEVVRDARHPLHDFPRGPMVELHRISGALTRAYAALLDTRAAAHTLVQEANRFRISADPDDPSVSIIGLEHLPAFEAGAYSFWQSALYEACRHGPRMLAALLLSQPDEQFGAQARRDREELLTHLRTLKPA